MSSDDRHRSTWFSTVGSLRGAADSQWLCSSRPSTSSAASTTKLPKYSTTGPLLQPTADLAQTPTSPSASILRSRPTDAASSFAPRRSPCSSGLVATSNRHHGRPFCAGVQVPYVLAQTSRPRRIRSDTLTLLSRPRLRQVYQEGVLLRQYPYQPQCVGYKLGQGACRPAGSVHGHLKRLAR